MKALTRNEATVVRSLLASEPVSERERIRRSGIPSRTFQGARQRAYADGWVFDRYLPDPVSIAKPYVTFVLGQPFAERYREVTDRWKNDLRCVLLWNWEETLFGIFFTGENPTHLGVEQLGPETFRRVFEFTADARKPHIPVFFDFEGSWSRIWELPGTHSYPHPLPSEIWEGHSKPILSSQDRVRIADMVERPFQQGRELGPLRVSPFYLPRSQRRLFEKSAVEHRVFLDLAKVPSYQHRPVERIAFVQGVLHPGGSVSALFRRLLAMKVFPFLFATDESKVLLGALSPAPRGPLSSTPRPAILVGLQRHLRSIEIVRESVSTMNVLVNHRYDRLMER
jgi:hypothetical protein